MTDPISQAGERARAAAARNLTIYAVTDAATTELDRLFWSLIPAIVQEANVTEADAVFHLRRAWVDHLKALKFSQGIDYRDDGRAAAWRVRLMLWRQGPQGQEDLVADSDPGARFDQYDVDPGQTILYGLPAVAAWVLELCTSAHPPGSSFDGLDAGTLAHKTKSLRVALSNSGGRSVWRIRYGVTPPAQQGEGAQSTLKAMLAQQGAAPQRFMAQVLVQREESPRHKGS